MSHKKAWKQFSYIKNDQSRDSQSQISDSRSSKSYRFNQVKFNKNKNQNQKSTIKFTLSNINKTKDNKKENSFIYQSNKRKQNSLIDIVNKQPIKTNMKTNKNRNIQIKMKKFLQDIHKIHAQIKMFAQNLLVNFEKIKQELQINLLNVSDELLKLGKDTKSIQKVHQIIQKGFSNIKQNMIILPTSLTQLNTSYSSDINFNNKLKNQVPSSPQLKFQQMQTLSKSRPKIASIFNRKQNSQILNQHDYQLPLNSNQKERTRSQTQRFRHMRMTSFDQQIIDVEQRNSPNIHTFTETNLRLKTDKQLDNVTNIDDIIFQMRIILNQSQQK